MDAQALFKQWMPWAQRVARTLWQERYSRRFEFQEIESPALEGLWKGCCRLDVSADERQQQGYLALCTQGAVLDWVRRQLPWGRAGQAAGMLAPIPLSDLLAMGYDPAVANDPGATLEASEEVELLMAGLTDQQSQAVRLRLLDGASLLETGQAMGLTDSSAHHHVHRALSRLRFRASARQRRA